MLDPLIWPDSAAIVDRHLTIGGCDLVALARDHGTPLYILDEHTLATTARRFAAALQAAYPAPYTVHYAGKALLSTPIARRMHALGLGLDCVSLGELAVARHAGIPLDQVHLHGNAKPRHELAQAIDWGVGSIIVDSLDELRILGALTADRTQPQPMLLRLNPGVDVHTHAHIQTGQLDSKFGLPIATGMAEAAVREALQLPGLRLLGVHAHLGSQIHELNQLQLGVDRLLAFAAEMQARYGWRIEKLSPGGGLGVPYRSGDPSPSIEQYARALADAVLRGCREHGLALPTLVIEPGRSLIARSIVALYEVLAVKAIPGVRTFVAIDGGMGDNIRPALYEAQYTALLADQVDAAPTATVTVAGRYCESGDVLLRDVPLPPVSAGALLAVAMCGAYTLSMASNYNLVPRPPLIGVADGTARVLVRRETIDDLLRRDTNL